MRRATTFAIGTSAVIALAAAVISSSRAIGQREGELASPEDGHWNRVNVLAAAVPTPIQCRGCWFPLTQLRYFNAARFCVTYASTDFVGPGFCPGIAVDVLQRFPAHWLSRARNRLQIDI